MDKINHVVIALVNKISMILYRSKITISRLIDFKKIFATVNYFILIHKLRRYVIHGSQVI